MTSFSVPHLPHDLVLSEVFIRLPAESLAQFKIVCKKWHSYISSSQFAQLHHRRWTLNPNIQPPSCAFVLSSTNLFMLKYDVFDLNTNGGVGTESLLQMCGSNIFGECAFLIGSCNGLVCLDCNFYSSKCNFRIFNPCTGQNYQVPEPVVDYAGCNLIFGFGYVSSLDDYKIVVVGVRWNRSLVIVYSLYSKKWRVACEFNEEDLPQFLTTAGVLVGETLHWDVYGGRMPGSIVSIVGFNLVEEAFQEVKLPFEVRSFDSYYYVKVCVIDGCLCVWEESAVGTTGLWKLNEYRDWGSWTKMFQMDWPALGFASCEHFFGFTKTGMFLVITDDGEIMLANPNQVPPMLVPILEDFHVLDAVSYVLTLISPIGTPLNGPLEN